MMQPSTTNTRYHRQIILKEFGETAQQKLLKARVLVIGAGGLGCPLLQYLAAAGVGHIGIADDDVVSLSNLHRQPLYDTCDIGQPKVEVARKKLLALNPEISIDIYPVRWAQQHCLLHFPEYDVVVDGSDNFATRYLVNDGCVLLNKPLLFGAVSQYEGQVGLLNAPLPDGTRSCHYRDLFPTQPSELAVANCAQAGVLGTLPATIGSIMATELIKYIAGIGILLINRVLLYRALTQETITISLQKNAAGAALVPENAEKFSAMDYVWSCVEGEKQFSISIPAFYELLDSKEVAVIDVRNYEETPVIDGFADRRIPLSILENHLPELDAEALVFVCQTGKRSEAAVLLANTLRPGMIAYSLEGGMLAYCAQRNLTQHE